MPQSNSTLKNRKSAAAASVPAPRTNQSDDLLINIINDRPQGDPRISAYGAVAASFGLPLWAMMIPGTTRDMFEDLTKMTRLVRLMRDYLDSTDSQRSSIETVAAGLAELNRQRAAQVPSHV
jgi:hypothetical protein